MDESQTILLVDDDAPLRTLIRDFLAGYGYRILEADGGTAMRRVLADEQVNVIVLDVMMPGEDGLSLARSLGTSRSFGIIMVSALGSETDRIVGLEIGADDYLPKPISPRELLARIRALVRRQHAPSEPQHAGSNYCFGNWRLDPVRRILRDPDKVVISLSGGEFSILQTFLDRPQRVLSRDQLLEYARGRDSDAYDRAIDTQISRLRRKLASRGDRDMIRTVRNEGYMFMPKVTKA